MHPLIRTSLLCGAVLSGCTTELAERNEDAREMPSTGSVADAAPPKAAPDAGGTASDVVAAPDDSGTSSNDSDAASDAAITVCPIRVSGTLLTETDCHACIAPGARCVSMYPNLRPASAEGCVNIIGLTSTLWCAWYADGDLVDRPNPISTCESNPGRVVCGGGL